MVDLAAPQPYIDKNTMLVVVELRESWDNNSNKFCIWSCSFSPLVSQLMEKECEREMHLQVLYCLLMFPHQLSTLEMCVVFPQWTNLQSTYISCLFVILHSYSCRELNAVGLADPLSCTPPTENWFQDLISKLQDTQKIDNLKWMKNLCSTNLWFVSLW